ncbi:MAG TPA: thiamine pyrophosphate-binding protein [Terrimesophilobacter sp.]|nr:thiamine pyrophosphate-binding protein [Terrimesophilobacter sp.]
MYIHEAIAQRLVDHGITTVFGLVGDGNLFWVDDYAKFDATNYIAVANEEGAILAANGYAQVTGEVGVATVTHGPAITNTITALVESVRDSAPLLVVVGDTAPDDSMTLQKIPQREFIIPTGAGFEQARSERTLLDDLDKALRRAMAERRPIVFNIPINFQWEEVEYSSVEPPWPVSQAVSADPESIEQVVAMLATVKRPIVVAGRGAVDSREPLIALAARIGAPLMTTLRGKDLFSDQTYNLGVFGTLSSPGGVEAIAASDFVIALGSRLDRWGSVNGSLFAGKRVVQVDTRREILGSMTVPTLGIVGDAGKVADQIVELLDEVEIPATGFRDTHPEWYRTESAATKQPEPDKPVAYEDALVAIQDAVPADRIYVLDAGRFSYRALTAFSVPGPRSFVYTMNFGSIGLGMGNAIGAAAAAPDRPVLMVCGDGGFMLGGLTEFNTAVRHNLDIIVVLFNDRSYGAEHIQLRARGLDPAISVLDWPDFTEVARALGGEGYAVSTTADLAALPQVIADRTKPLLIEVRLDPDQVTIPGK